MEREILRRPDWIRDSLKCQYLSVLSNEICSSPVWQFRGNGSLGYAEHATLKSNCLAVESSLAAPAKVAAAAAAPVMNIAFKWLQCFK